MERLVEVILATRPIFSVAFLMAIGGIYVILKTKKHIKERKLRRASFAKSSVRSESPLDQLPKEILETIFEFLDARGISTASTASKYWNHSTESDLETGLKNFDHRIASLKTTKSTLERLSGREINDRWVKDSEFPACYPKQWIIQDCERWKIFEFTKEAVVHQFFTLFSADPTVACRIRGKYLRCSNDLWVFGLEEDDYSYLLVRKDPGSPVGYPYYPCEDIIEEEGVYEIITSMMQPNLHIMTCDKIHAMRRLDGQKHRPYPRLPASLQLTLVLILITAAVVAVDFTLSHKFNTGPFHPEFSRAICARGPCGYLFEDVIASLIFVYVFFIVRGTLPRFDRRRIQQVKFALWLLANYAFFIWIRRYSLTYGWWYAKAVMGLQGALTYFVPDDLFQLCGFFDTPKKGSAGARFRSLTLAMVSSPLVVLFVQTVLQPGWWEFRIQTYLIHATLLLTTYAYGRLVLLNAIRLMNPKEFVSPRGWKEWLGWSTPVKWWLFIALVGPVFFNPGFFCFNFYFE